MTKTKTKTSEKRQNKGHHIDVRFTEEEYNQIVANAAKCGMPKACTFIISSLDTSQNS